MWYENTSDMLGQLPEFYGELREAGLIAKGADAGLDGFRQRMGAVLDGYWTRETDLWVLRAYQRMFELEQTGDLEKQMDAVRSAFRSRLPINCKRVEDVCVTLLGEGASLRLDIDYGKYICHAKYRADMTRNREAVLAARLRTMVPANMIISVAYDYVEWQGVQSKTWGQMAVLTWAQMREQGDQL